jgi:hypothetical protein
MSEKIQIYFEWPDQYGIHKASIGSDAVEKLKEQSEKAMNLAMGSIHQMADKISSSIKAVERGSRPDEVEVEFGIKLDLEGGSVVPLVAKTTAGGQFTIHFKWKIEKPEEAHVLVEKSA